MNPALEQLAALQAADLRVHAHQIALAALPAREEQARRRVLVARSALAAQHDALRSLEVARRSGEREAEALRAQEKRYESQTLQVKTNDELRALQHEIDDTRRRRGDIETTVLEKMEAEDEARRGVAAGERAIEDAERTAAQEGEQVAEERARLEAAREAALQERERIAEAVPADWRARYERLRQGKPDAVVVALVRGACSGCFTAQPPSRVQTIRAGEQPVSCEYCGRWIVGIRE